MWPWGNPALSFYLAGLGPPRSSQRMWVVHRSQSSCCCWAGTPDGSLYRSPVRRNTIYGQYLCTSVSSYRPHAPHVRSLKRWDKGGNQNYEHITILFSEAIGSGQTGLVLLPSRFSGSLHRWPAGRGRLLWCRESTRSWWWGRDVRKCFDTKTPSSPPPDQLSEPVDTR